MRRSRGGIFAFGRGWRRDCVSGGGGKGVARGVFGGAVGEGCRERLSFGFCRRKNQPPSFPRCRFEAGRGRTGVQSGPAAKRHHRKIRRLFLRGSPAKSKRKPLHHVLRTAGTGRAIEGGALRGGGGGARSCGRGREGSGFRMRDTQAGEEGRCGGEGAKRSLKHTGARPVDGVGRGRGGNGTASALGERSCRTANSHTDGHGQARTASGGRKIFLFAAVALEGFGFFLNPEVSFFFNGGWGWGYGGEVCFSERTCG